MLTPLIAKKYSIWADKSVEYKRITDDQKILVIPAEPVKIKKTGCFVINGIFSGGTKCDFNDDLISLLRERYNTENWKFLPDYDDSPEIRRIRRTAIRRSESQLIETEFKRNLKYRDFPENKRLIQQFDELKKKYDFDYAIVWLTSTVEFPCEKTFVTGTQVFGTFVPYTTTKTIYIQHPVIEVFVFDGKTGKMLFDAKHITDTKIASQYDAFKKKGKTIENAVKSLKNVIRSQIKSSSGGFFSN